MSLLTQVSSAIRILRWNRDVSARASHLVVEKDPLITYESVNFSQAGLENVSRSTVFFERKLMSTKTSIKRIAAVAAVALTLGGFSAVSANAVKPAADTLAASNTSVAATAGVESKVYVTQTFLAADSSNTAYVVAALISAPALNTALPTWDTNTVTGYTNTNATVTTAAQTITTAATTSTAGQYTASTTTLKFTPVKSGTYTIKLLPYVNDGNTAVAGNAAAITITYTVAPKAGITAATSTHYLGLTTVAATSAATDYEGLVTASKSAATAVANINVTADNALTGGTADATFITATVSGPGLVSLSSDGTTTPRAKTVTTASATKTPVFYIFADGSSGLGTVTIASTDAAGVTTVLGTNTVTFYGSAASYTATVTNGIVTTVSAVAADVAAHTVATPAYRAVKVLVKDANGAPVTGAYVYAISDDLTVINANYLTSSASGATGYAYFNLVGLKAGTANISFTSASSAADAAAKVAAGTAVITAPAVSIRVGSNAPDSVSIGFDSSTYTPGAAANILVTVKDVTGLPVADGVYTVFTGATASTLAFLQGNTPGTSVTGTNDPTDATIFATPTLTVGQVWVKGGTGTATLAVNMPMAAGDVTVSGLGASTLGIAQAGVMISGTATVGADASVQAATDAAQEATDAANAAYDAANNAMDSADAATAAAQDASDNASAALAAVTSLAATVAKLVKSIAAITAAVAKIQKKIGA